MGGGDETNRRNHKGSMLYCAGESDLDMFLLYCNVFSM